MDVLQVERDEAYIETSAPDCLHARLLHHPCSAMIA